MLIAAFLTSDRIHPRKPILMITHFSSVHGSLLEFKFAAQSQASRFYTAPLPATLALFLCQVGDCSVTWSPRPRLGEAMSRTGTSMNFSTPVVVLSPHHHGALGIFRSLGVLGVPVYAVEDGQSSPPLRSRYCRGVFHWNVRTAVPQASIDSLLAVSEHFKTRPILIPTSDATAALIQEAAEQLQEAYRFLIPPRGLVGSLSSKRELFFLCREYGHPTPETFFPHSRSEVVQLLKRVVFPIVLKGIDDRVVFGQTKVAMHIAQSADELLQRYDTLESQQKQNVMLQEYIPGEADSVWMFNGYFNEKSECLAGFMGR